MLEERKGAPEAAQVLGSVHQDRSPEQLKPASILSQVTTAGLDIIREAARTRKQARPECRLQERDSDLSRTEAQAPASEVNRESEARAQRRGRNETQATAKQGGRCQRSKRGG